MKTRNTVVYLTVFCCGLFIAAFFDGQNWVHAMRLSLVSILCVLGMRLHDAINKSTA
ncbi:hypothetical protein [Polaromonas sp. YR568]|uniref:hypothetical protein n=1 Tax=Polaromonas sp. YR568 TaxID=1855301 RepID=UPI003137C0E7